MTFDEYMKLPLLHLPTLVRREGAMRADAISVRGDRWRITYIFAGGRTKTIETASCRLEVK